MCSPGFVKTNMIKDINSINASTTYKTVKGTLCSLGIDEETNGHPIHCMEVWIP